jgi:hypothetical protein
MIEDNLEFQVKLFVADQTLSRIDEIAIQTNLRQDLGIDGDDAVVFFSLFSIKFNVDLSEFEIDKYFGPEAGLISIFFLPFYDCKDPPSLKDSVITVEDLINAAKSGKWDKG